MEWNFFSLVNYAKILVLISWISASKNFLPEIEVAQKILDFYTVKTNSWIPHSTIYSLYHKYLYCRPSFLFGNLMGFEGNIPFLQPPLSQKIVPTCFSQLTLQNEKKAQKSLFLHVIYHLLVDFFLIGVATARKLNPIKWGNLS